MSLKYSLTENLLTGEAEDYSARIHEVKSHDMESIIEFMLEKGSTVTRADVLAVLNNFFEVAASMTSRGESINTDLLKTSFSIAGNFEGATDGFDKTRHSLKVNTTAGKLLKDALAKVHPEKIAAAEVVPHVIEVRDTISGSVNDKIVIGSVIEIVGDHLKVEGDDPSVGIYLEDSSNVKHKITAIVDNKPTRLLVIVPALSPADYKLHIISQYSPGTLLKSPREGSFHKRLSLVAS